MYRPRFFVVAVVEVAAVLIVVDEEYDRCLFVAAQVLPSVAALAPVAAAAAAAAAAVLVLVLVLFAVVRGTNDINGGLDDIGSSVLCINCCG